MFTYQKLHTGNEKVVKDFLFITKYKILVMEIKNKAAFVFFLKELCNTVVPIIGSWYMFGTVSLICGSSIHFVGWVA